MCKMTRRKVIFVFLFLFACAQTAFGYSDTTTHPALTDEIVDFYNLNFGQKLTVEEKEWIVQGSMEEDTPPRWINHFLDPISREGWTGEHTGVFSSSTLQAFSAIALFHEEPAAADKWAHDQALQSKYGAYKGNRTWERALYEYVNGNKKDAYITLGHILHLIEDMTVPEHTRNDTHAHDLRQITGDYGSPYEEYTKRYTRENLRMAENLQAQELEPYELPSLEEYFYALAMYSNNYFFSKDTILDLRYDQPTVIRESGNFVFGKDSEGEEFVLATRRRFWDPKDLVYKSVLELTEKPSHFPILESYFQRLSREAVLAGAGVVDLFHEEAERLKDHPEEMPKIYQPEDIMAFLKNHIPSPVGEGFKVVQLAQKIKQKTSDAINTVKSIVARPPRDVFEEQGAAVALTEQEKLQQNPEVEPQETISVPVRDNIQERVSTNNLNNEQKLRVSLQSNVQPEEVEITPQLSGENSGQEREGGTAQRALSEATKPPPVSSAPVIPPISPAPPGMGGGMPTPVRETEESAQIAAVVQALPADTMAPEVPIVLGPLDGAVLTVAQINFWGTAEASSTILTDFSTATSTAATSTGAWQLSLSLPQGTTTIQFFAEDQSGNHSLATTTEVFIDSLAPLLTSFSIAECAGTLVQGDCVVATTTATFSWQGAGDDIAGYLIDCTTTATSSCANIFPLSTASTTFALVLPDFATYAFSASAIDRAGNRSATSSALFQINVLPIVINEVAWAGTAGSVTDEWIELKNNTNKTINLSGWTLYSKTEPYPYIPLSGDIAAGGYFLIERQEDNTISDIPADLINNFGGNSAGNGLSNAGAELLMLAHASTTIDRTLSCGLYGTWCGGSTGFQSMERRDPLQAGNIESNWGTHSNMVSNGQDKNGNPLTATPRARNSLHYFISSGTTLSGDKILTKANSPYIVPQSQILTIPNGKTLTLEPGVVVKFGSEAAIKVLGNIVADGTAQFPIVFTGITDDGYGGDTNNDGICNTADASSTASCPVAGSWENIQILGSASSSSFSHTTFRYGGRWFTGVNYLGSLLYIENSAVSISDAVFEYSQRYGVELVNSNATIQRSIFREHNYNNTSVAGIVVEGGAPVISENTFTHNYRGIYISSSSATLTNNAFSSSTQEAVVASHSHGVYSENTGSHNGINGIRLEGTIAEAGATTTLYANDIAYVFSSGSAPTVPANSTVVINPGVVFKGTSGNGLSVLGTLKLAGVSAGDIIFTVLEDDTVAGDTNNNGASAGTPGAWSGIYVNGGRIEGTGFSVYYGGNFIGGGDNKGGVRIERGYFSIDNALFENNYMFGLRLSHATGTVSNTLFRGHRTPGFSSSTALGALVYSSLELRGVTFINNGLGVYRDSTSSTTVSDVIFSENTATSSPANIF